MCQVPDPEEMQILMHNLDADGNGTVDFEEFLYGGMGQIILDAKQVTSSS